ncbi:unnamed protein product [Rotaria sordida]|uniref:PRA1 family protein n=1 Tax=Rotaria sordida TaxID=392033 RepID=A0A814ILJ1_9BILA|nr:unnamed protein product [Rotaria sordida]CAF1330884.1 unnamed protein product [Rotaria sordida]
MAQYSAGSLLTRIDDTSSIVPKRELVSTERIEVKKRNPEPVRVPEKQNDQLKYDRKIDSNRKDQVISRDIHTAPIRSLNDFLFDATWNVPRYDDDARIQNRIISNLIYYQTNYFIFGIACVLLLGIMFPVDFLIILSLVLSLVNLGNDSSSASRHQANRNVSSIRQRHSSASRQGLSALAFFILLGVAFYKLSLLNILFILLFGILLPILAIMFHAILRKRTLANKLSNQIDRIRSHTTPMAIFLEKLRQITSRQSNFGLAAVGMDRDATVSRPSVHGSPDQILKLLNQEKDRIMKNIDERGCITQEEADFLNQQTENALEETLNKFKQQAIQQLKIQSEDTKEEVHFKISFSNHLLKWLPDLFQ